MAIILARHGQPAIRLERTTIDRESYLQQYIFAHPDALPLDEVDEDVRLLVLLREFPTSSGPIDALAIDGDGRLYLIETKLYKNPDKRLVLAQILDYGAALWKGYVNGDEFVDRIDALMTEKGGRSLRQALSDTYGPDA